MKKQDIQKQEQFLAAILSSDRLINRGLWWRAVLIAYILVCLWILSATQAAPPPPPDPIGTMNSTFSDPTF
jgi:hypothetical protein